MGHWFLKIKALKVPSFRDQRQELYSFSNYFSYYLDVFFLLTMLFSDMENSCISIFYPEILFLCSHIIEGLVFSWLLVGGLFQALEAASSSLTFWLSLLSPFSLLSPSPFSLSFLHTDNRATYTVWQSR